MVTSPFASRCDVVMAKRVHMRKEEIPNVGGVNYSTPRQIFSQFLKLVILFYLKAKLFTENCFTKDYSPNKTELVVGGRAESSCA